MSGATRIPITMCHGLTDTGESPITAEHFDRLMRIASELEFTSINYNDLAAWRAGEAELPARPIMFDFDHAVKTMVGVDQIMSRYGFKGTLFVHTAPLDGGEDTMKSKAEYMGWDDVARLRDSGWHIGAHTVTHPNLSRLSREDPGGQRLRDELAGCDASIEKHLGLRPRDFAYTGTSFSAAAEREVSKRYRFGRLWIVGSKYQCDGGEVRYAEMVGVPGADEADGGPPMAARYITKETPAYRLPSMEIQYLIYREESFRKYLEGAVGEL